MRSLKGKQRGFIPRHSTHQRVKLTAARTPKETEHHISTSTIQSCLVETTQFCEEKTSCHSGSKGKSKKKFKAHH